MKGKLKTHFFHIYFDVFTKSSTVQCINCRKFCKDIEFFVGKKYI